MKFLLRCLPNRIFQSHPQMHRPFLTGVGSVTESLCMNLTDPSLLSSEGLLGLRVSAVASSGLSSYIVQLRLKGRHPRDQLLFWFWGSTYFHKTAQMILIVKNCAFPHFGGPTGRAHRCIECMASSRCCCCRLFLFPIPSLFFSCEGSFGKMLVYDFPEECKTGNEQIGDKTCVLSPQKVKFYFQCMLQNERALIHSLKQLDLLQTAGYMASTLLQQFRCCYITDTYICVSFKHTTIFHFQIPILVFIRLNHVKLPCGQVKIFKYQQFRVLFRIAVQQKQNKSHMQL